MKLTLQDRDFLERAAQGTNAEISIGALTPDRARRPEVASFGQLMVSHHTGVKKELAALARKRRIALPESLGAEQQSFDRLLERRGEEFDREFARVMVESHQTARQLFQNAAAGAADPELKSFASKTLPMIEMHLTRAEELAAAIGQVPSS
jgi:putative membrane protein